MACAININDPNALNMERLNYVAQIIERTQTFVQQVYLPDVVAILSYYPEWTRIGGGLRNYIAYGDYPMGHYGELSTYKSPRGIVVDRDLSQVIEFDPWAMDGLLEFVNNSWYSYTQGKEVGLHPSVGETRLDYTGATPPYEYLDRDQPYSWIKTPRYKGMPMETGPLARNIVAHACGDETYRAITRRCPRPAGSRLRGDVPLPPHPSPRTHPGPGHRGQSAGRLADRLLHRPAAQHQTRRLPHVQRYQVGTRHLARIGSGGSLTEAPRGSLPTM